MSTQRISTQTLYDVDRRTPSARATSSVLKLQLSIADGRAMRTPSDDPVRAHQAMWYREQMRATEQYERSLQTVDRSR